MPIMRDIKNRDTKKILSLKKEGNVMNSKKNENLLDLRKTNTKKKQKVIHDIDFKNKKHISEYLFFANKNEDGEKQKKSYKEFTRFLVFGVIIVFLINMLHITNQLFNISSDIQANAFAGYSSFVKGGENAMQSNFGGAVQYFDAASHAFEEAQNKVWFLGNNGVISSKESLGDSAYAILESGKHISNAASYFTQSVSGLQEIPVLFLENNTNSDRKLKTKPVSLTAKLKSSLNLIDKALDEVEIAQVKLKVAGHEFLPKSFKENFNALSHQLNDLVIMLNDLQQRIPAILDMLGDRYPHRYLVLLQNNTESRPTGGFIGSYLIVDVSAGYITNMKFKDVYESDGQLHEQITPPAELALFTDNWRMRDSNYSPHFPASAEKAAWFLEKAKGPGVDSVIAVNQTILGDLLSLTGPLDIDGLEAPLTSENYNTVLTYIIESKLEGEENPKDILSHVIPAVESNIYGKASFNSLLTLVQTGIQKKEILAWSRNERVQHFFGEIGMASEVEKETDSKDYFSLSSINVGGNKSDIYITSEIVHETVIDKSGELNNFVTYKRAHTWNPNVTLQWKKQLEPFGFTEINEVIGNILGRGANKSIIKIYLPAGTVLNDVKGVKMEDITVGYDEVTNKTYIYFLSEIEPQSEHEVVLSYKLPFDLNLSVADEYRLTVQKQPGYINNTAFKKRIIFDPRVTNYRNYPEEIVFKKDEALEFETMLTNDLRFASLWGIE